MKKKYNITLVVGDWSGDGHDKTYHAIVTSNLSQLELLEAYKKGTEKLGFDLINNVACDYEDNELPEEKLQALIANGLDLNDYCIHKDNIIDQQNIVLYPSYFVDLYLFIVKLGNSEFEFEVQLNDVIAIGGYGLFV